MLQAWLALITAVALGDHAGTPLAEWPMIMAHDAATTYLEGGRFKIVNRWTKTQADGGFTGMLGCGTRAFDLRPGPWVGGKLMAHHGRITVHHEVGSILDEVVAWAAEHHSGPRDLVVLAIAEAHGNVTDGMKALLEEHHIPYYTDCSGLNGMSMETALKKSKLPGGGYVMATFDCWQANYNKTIACSGLRDGEGREASWRPEQENEEVPESLWRYTCYQDDKRHDFPFRRMHAYIDGVLTAGPPADGQLYALQALWQETPQSVIVSSMHGSSLLLDEERSSLNKHLLSRVQAGQMDVKRLNFLELNNVCDSGQELLAAVFEQRAAASREASPPVQLFL